MSRLAAFSLFHRYIFDRFQELIDGTADAREVHQAPRGEAKSTYETQLGSLWCICRANYLAGVVPHASAKARKWLIGIIMNTLEQSIEMLEAIKGRTRRQSAPGGRLPQGSWPGPHLASVDHHYGQRYQTPRRQFRKNARHAPWSAPAGTVFLDDLENDDNVRQKEQRDACESFVIKAVVGLAGPAGGMDIFQVLKR